MTRGSLGDVLRSFVGDLHSDPCVKPPKLGSRQLWRNAGENIATDVWTQPASGVGGSIRSKKLSSKPKGLAASFFSGEDTPKGPRGLKPGKVWEQNDGGPKKKRGEPGDDVEPERPEDLQEDNYTPSLRRYLDRPVELAPPDLRPTEEAWDNTRGLPTVNEVTPAEEFFSPNIANSLDGLSKFNPTLGCKCGHWTAAPAHPEIDFREPFLVLHPDFATRVQTVHVQMRDTTADKLHWDAKYDIQQFRAPDEKVRLWETTPHINGSGSQLRFLKFCPPEGAGKHTYELTVSAFDKNNVPIDYLQNKVAVLSAETTPAGPEMKQVMQAQLENDFQEKQSLPGKQQAPAQTETGQNPQGQQNGPNPQNMQAPVQTETGQNPQGQQNGPNPQNLQDPQNVQQDQIQEEKPEPPQETANRGGQGSARQNHHSHKHARNKAHVAKC